MHYRTYSTEDFLFDESFRQWTSGTSAEATAFWEEWLQTNPDRIEVVRQAQELVRALNNYYQDDVTETRLISEQNRLMQLAAEQRDANVAAETPVIPLWQQSWLRWSAAASVLLLLGLGGWFYSRERDKKQLSHYKQLTRTVPIALRETKNTSNKAIHVLLSDGSLVTLQPKSRLSYPKQFTQNSRTVFLKGEAFFDVVRNPDRPFLIYANQTVTKVLGTSFLVRAFECEPNVVVTVRSGRVSVFKQTDFEKSPQAGLRQVQGVILTPNQQTTFSMAKNQFAKALVQPSKTLLPIDIIRERVFEDAPVATVFRNIEKTYGLKIHYKPEELSACLVNLSFSNESLIEQLDITTETIGGTYEIRDGQIFISSRGCR
ncbi:FecR family protein [Spirosoma daeguense]